MSQSESSQSTTEQVKSHATGIVKRSVNLAQESVTSLGWTYPLRGIPYFWQNEKLRGPLMKQILPSLGISAGILAAMFTFTYLPQAAVLAIFQLGPLGFVTAVGVVLTESAFIINLVLRTFFFNEALTETFDNVLLMNKLDNLVANGREIDQAASSKSKTGIKSAGKKLLMKPLARFQPEAIAQYLLTIPLNAIPVAGTAIFFAINGVKRGPSQMDRYHQLKKFSPEDKKRFIHDHRGAYSALGVASMLLELVPFIGPIIMFSNEAGAALLAVDLEKRQGKVQEGEMKLKGGSKRTE